MPVFTAYCREHITTVSDPPPALCLAFDGVFLKCERITFPLGGEDFHVINVCKIWRFQFETFTK